MKCFYLTVEMTEIKAQSAACPVSSVLFPNGTDTECTLNTYALCALLSEGEIKEGKAKLTRVIRALAIGNHNESICVLFQISNQ